MVIAKLNDDFKISSIVDSVRDNVNEQIGCKDHMNAALTVVKIATRVSLLKKDELS